MDIIFSSILLIFFVYCFVLVGIQAPSPTPTELGAAFWPRIILIFLIFLLALNLYTLFKKAKINGKINILVEIQRNCKAFEKNKLFIGMFLVALMAIAMPFIGFIPVCFLFLFAYGILIGAKKKGSLSILTLLITLLIYLVFQGALDIMLARGIGFFRSFALLCEGLLPF